MRTELEQIEIIEEYLSGKMSPTDADNFEKEMETDPKLRENVQLQRDLVKGIDRVAIKQSAQKAYRKYKGGKGGMSWMLGTIAVVLIAAAAMWFVNRDDNGGLPPLNEKGEALWADADRYLTPQLFTINNKNDTVIETEGGIVFVVPANCFLDKDGDPVAGAVELEVKEALNASDIMQSGLTSMSGDDLLESGGMFYINGRRDGETLKIDPDKGIYFEVPTDDKKAGMKLYSGARKADGTIDWQDARDLDNFLIPVDILTLDFYPPDYIEALIEMDEAAGDREFTDSLYYSFAFGNIEQLSDVVYMDTTSMSESFLNAWEPTWYYSDTIVAEMPAGINPAKIKAIWAAEFQNTNLATREFEERLPTIHRSCNAAVLELYIDNLGKNLSEIDAMAGAITTGHVKEALLGFAGRNDGKVEDGNRYAYRLKAYYVKKQKVVMAAVKKTTLAYQKKQADLQKKAQQRQMEQSMDDVNRQSQNYIDELHVNLKEAYRQLGKPWPSPPPPRDTYNGTISAGGWNNVDRAVMESTSKRETLDFTDKDGKKAVIKYEKITVELSAKGYDRLYIYLLPDGLNSFMRMKGATGVRMYSEKLNELFNYDLICLAYKGDEAFVVSLENVQPKVYADLTLTKISIEDLDTKLKALKNMGQSGDMLKEIANQQFEIANQKRIQRNRARAALKREIRPAVFPCERQNYMRPVQPQSAMN